ncbi:FUSC family protein [Actinacidiphila sp. DG2A-62]|uniref:FUSC family protein n=1 Tax=Actinacidiphila sp. DG2A-62 TaxID=3108821 RepID=UPI002DB9959D|nr:FUSC family protein [Actinacidiphila sp. DG2A-62]MEC3998387.1 FUSC family protein [Actinacidiphila sp. DG2A-62]
MERRTWTWAARAARAVAAPDPGRLRLRSAARAVLGISAAVAAVLLAGLPLPAACGGGLAALLAFFTVADATVRRQAVTTALLPAAGVPVLAAASALHPWPAARDAAFVAVVMGGVYARRWGPRGNALGVFAFMMFFVAQFLHAAPGDLPELLAAVGIGLGAAATVRFGLWCHERGAPPPAAALLPAAVPAVAGRGPRRPTTRQAVQAATAAAAALGLGEAVSGDRWYWAVAASWWIFVNTASRGETLVRGFRRVLGTATGVAAGFALAAPLHGAAVPSAVLVAACVFGIFYSAPVSYSWMTFFVTVMAGTLYGLLGVLRPALLALRLEETLVGAGTAALAVLLVLPVTTHAATDAWVRCALHAVRDVAARTARHLDGAAATAGTAGSAVSPATAGAVGTARTAGPADAVGPGGEAPARTPDGDLGVPRAGGVPGAATDPGGVGAAADLAGRAAELDAVLGRVRISLGPLLHPLNPHRARRARALRVLALLDDCAREARGLARTAADPRAGHDARLLAACRRVEHAVLRLLDPDSAPAAPRQDTASASAPGPRTASAASAPAPSGHPHAERALAHLHGLESALRALAAPLRPQESAAPAA